MRVLVTRRFLLGEGFNRYIEVGETLEGEPARIAASLDAGDVVAEPPPGTGAGADAPVELPEDPEPAEDQPPT